MKVTGINSTQTPSFGVKIPTKELKVSYANLQQQTTNLHHQPLQ